MSKVCLVEQMQQEHDEIRSFSYEEGSCDYDFDYAFSTEKKNDRMSDYCQSDSSSFIDNIGNPQTMPTTFSYHVNEKDGYQLPQATCQSQNVNHSELIQQVEKRMKSSKTLHTNLLVEAANIRKWKQQKEHEVRQMEFSLNQKEEVIKNLRKNLLDVRLENERISQKVGKDDAFYEETNKKLETVRELMIVAKSYFGTIGTHVQTFQKLKSTMEAMTKKRLDDVQDIYEKINEYYNVTEDKIEKMIELRQHEIQEAESQYNTELQKAEELLMKLNKALEEKGRTEERLEFERNNLLSQIQTYETEKQSYLSELDKLKLELSENKDRVESLELMRKTFLDSQLELETKLAITEKEIRDKDENAVLSKEMITTLQNKVYNDGNKFMKEREDLTIDLDKEKLRCEMIRKDLDETQETLKTTKEQLQEMEKKFGDASIDIETLRKKEADLVEVQSGLETKLNEKDDELKVLKETSDEIVLNYKNEILALNESIETMSENYKELQKELSNAKNEAYSKEIEQKKIDLEKFQISEENGLLKNELQNIKSNVEKLEDKLSAISLNYSELKEEKESLEKHSNAVTHELSELTTTVESVRCENQDYQEKLDSACQEITALKEEIMEIEDDLKEKSETIETLQNELESAKSNFQNKTVKDKQAVTNLDTKVKTLKSEILLKSKNVKDLEKELKSLKDKMAVQTKDQTKLEETLEKKNQLLREKESEIEKLTSEARANNRKIEEVSLEAQSYCKEKETAKALFDTQMRDMMNLMEKTQMSFQSNMVTKENELKEYKKQIGESQKIISQGELKDAELKKIKKECAVLESENKDLKRGKKKLEGQLDDLEDQIRKLKKNIVELNAKNNKQEEKLNEQCKTIKEQKLQNQTFKEQSQALKNMSVASRKAKHVDESLLSNSSSEISSRPIDQYDLINSDSSPTMEVEDFLKMKAAKGKLNPGPIKRRLFDNKPAEPAKRANVTEPPHRPNIRWYPPKVTTSPRAHQTRRLFVNEKKMLGEEDSDQSLV